MKRYLFKLFTTMVILLMVSPFSYGAIRVVAAENVYGAIAAALGGTDVSVISILNNPTQDPHLFSAKPSTSMAVADADILLLNGADYDVWFSRLLSAKSSVKPVSVINVADLVGVKAGANPHLWYRLTYIEQVAVALTKLYEQRLPAKRAVFAARLTVFQGELQQLKAQVASLKGQVKGLPVTATEPVAAYLAEDVGLVMLDQAFQLAVMNDAEPSAQSRAQFEEHLKKHAVRALIYNQQVQDPVTEFMQKLCRQQKIPIIGVTELLPVDQSYPEWYQATLTRFRVALT